MNTISSTPASVIELADELRSVLKHLVRRLRQEEHDEPNSGLSLHQKLLLSTLSAHPGIGVTELARRERLRGPTMSGHVKALENAGLVQRNAPKAEDRRRVGLQLSPHGLAVLEGIRTRRRDWLASQLARLSEDGASALRRAMPYLKEIGE